MSFDVLTAVCGLVIGFSLGLTGGGGSIFAVPLLIYALRSEVREAVGISLAAVGATSLFGAAMQSRTGNLDWRTGLVFAAAGMGGAPVGTWAGGKLPDAVTLSLFAILMLAVGARMWANRGVDEAGSSLCSRRMGGQLHWSPRCFSVLLAAGFLVGFLSGVFGVGGGFIIVPALVLVTGMSMHAAVATSLLVIGLICVSGVTSYVLAGDLLPLRLTILFAGGGLVGMIGGNDLRTRLPGPALKRVFAAGMWLVALFVLAQQVPEFFG